MKVLFVSASPIKKEVSIGNTFLNLFENIEDVELASVYTRNGTPDVKLSRCFCITEKMLIKNILKKSPAGKEITFSSQESSNLEENTINAAKKYRLTIFFWLQDIIWKFGHWKSKELEEFVLKYNPDIIFTVLTNSVYLNNLILHIKKISGKKLVIYAWDNNYSLKRFMISPFRWLKLIIDRASMRKVVNTADLFYVISSIQKDEYKQIFNKNCKILTKSDDFSQEPPIKQSYNSPLQFVFTGNIATNRWKTLALIAKALKDINAEGVRAQLRIYTGTPITKKMSRSLNIDNTSYIMGSVSGDMISKIQKDADVLVHVEGFDLKNRCALHQSFSTKIVDYFKEARPILAVAPKDVASIDELKRHDGAMIVTDKTQIRSKIEELIANDEVLSCYSKKAYYCGKNYHSNDFMKKMLYNDLNELISRKVEST